MTNTEPEVADNGRYSLSETCKVLKLSIKTVLKYTDTGDLKHGIHKHNGRKFYKGSEIKKFWKASY